MFLITSWRIILRRDPDTDNVKDWRLVRDIGHSTMVLLRKKITTTTVFKGFSTFVFFAFDSDGCLYSKTALLLPKLFK